MRFAHNPRRGLMKILQNTHPTFICSKRKSKFGNHEIDVDLAPQLRRRKLNLPQGNYKPRYRRAVPRSFGPYLEPMHTEMHLYRNMRLGNRRVTTRSAGPYPGPGLPEIEPGADAVSKLSRSKDLLTKLRLLFYMYFLN